MSVKVFGTGKPPAHYYGQTPPTNAEVYDLWTMAPAVGSLWTFIYQPAGSGTFPWQFLGGPPLEDAIVTEEQPASTAAWVDLTTAGPSITLPRAGEYNVEWGMYVRNASAAINSGNSGIGRVGDAANTLIQQPAGLSGALAPNLRIDPAAAAFVTSMAKGTYGRNAAGGNLAAADILRVKYFAGVIGGSGIFFGNRWIRLVPRRVS